MPCLQHDPWQVLKYKLLILDVNTFTKHKIDLLRGNNKYLL